MVTALAVLAITGATAAPAVADDHAPTWSDYRLGQFIASRGSAPSEILGLDNNGEILLACREDCTLKGLESAGVRVLASQLELLRAWSLLRGDGVTYRAAIPILDGEGATYLRELADGLVGKLAEAIAGDVAELVTTLEADGMEDHAWSVVFAYVLDGAVWDFLDELEVIGGRDAASRGGLWGGEVWAHLAGRELTSSTVRRSSVDVRISWVEALRPHVWSLLTGPASIGRLFEALERGEVESPELTTRFQEYGILGPERQLTVPLIVPDRENALYAICERLAERVATLSESQLNRAALVNDFGFASESQAMVVAYHEVMWSLMDRLVADGALTEPAAIADPESADAADIGKLVVMVRRAQEEPASQEPQGSTRDEG